MPSKPMKPRHWARAVANVVNLSTPLGIIIAVAGGSSFARGEYGLVVAEGYQRSFPVAGAFTVGNVIIIPKRTRAELETAFPHVMDHEDVHARQYSYCLGLPFLPAYLVAMAWSWLRTGDRAAANFFEIQADLIRGGYRNYPRRSVRQGLASLRDVWFNRATVSPTEQPAAENAAGAVASPAKGCRTMPQDGPTMH